MQWWVILGTLGIPSLLTTIVGIFLNQAIKKSNDRIEKKEKEREKEEQERIRSLELRETRMETFLMAILSSQRATNTLATATAKAIQRIPDAKCNGDMKAALKEAVECQAKETEFLTQLGLSVLSKSGEIK